MKRIWFLFFLLAIISCSDEGSNIMNRPPFPIPPFMQGQLPISPQTGIVKHFSWSVAGNLKCLDTGRTQSLQIDFPEPGTYTVEFSKGVPPLPAFPIPKVTMAEAEIIWKVAGNYVRRVVSVENGISISGVADGAIVTMRDATTDATAAGQEYPVVATVSKGVRAFQPNPPVLYRPNNRFSIDGGTVLQFAIPEDSGVSSVQVLCASATGVPIPDQGMFVRHLTGGTTLKRYDPRYSDWVSIAPGARVIEVGNLAAAGTFREFNITWGIDG